jgi:hypothetical protein
MKKIISIIVGLIFLLLTVSTAYAGDNSIANNSAIPAYRIDQTTDIRINKLKTYLEKHNSPLVEYADTFVQYADEYQFDEKWAMVAAIAGVESTFGKHIPKGSFNAWGWGIPTGARSGIGFDGWEDGIATVSQGLKEKYMEKGADSLPEIGRIYAPPSNTWAKNVQFFMNQIETTELPDTLTI